jgi:hypothetical protein
MEDVKDSTVEELQKRFRERSIALCGSEFDAVKGCKGACEPVKQALLVCMQTKVCEVLHERLQACTEASQQASLQSGMNRCLAFAYASLPPPESTPAAPPTPTTAGR